MNSQAEVTIQKLIESSEDMISITLKQGEHKEVTDEELKLFSSEQIT